MGYSDAYPGGYAVGGDVVTSLFIETGPDEWYDATADLISGSVVRGRQRELDRYQAGRAELLLDNDDRTYDPNHTASPLDGHIRPMKRIRLTATWAGETYPLFLGYADRWSQHRPGPHRGTTGLAATDGFKVLNKAILASSVYEQEVRADSPTVWWRCDEHGGGRLHDAVGDRDLIVTGSPELGAETLIDRDPGAAVRFTDAATQWAESPPRTVPTTTSATLEFWVMFISDEATLVLQNSHPGEGPDSEFQVAGAADFNLSVLWGDTNNTTGGSLAAGVRYHVVLVATVGQVPKLYVDGVDVNATGTVLGIPLRDDTIIVNDFVAGATPDFTVDEIAFYDYALPPARVEAHNAAGRTPWTGDTPAARLERVLDAVGWPEDLRQLDAGTGTLQGATLATTALEHAQKVAESEFGSLYVTAEGVLRFEGRDALVNQPSVADFEDIAVSGLGFTTSNPEISDDALRNEVTVSRLDGIAQTARDAASIGTYLTASYVLDGLIHDDDTTSRHAAEFIASEYARPVERVNQLSVNPYHDPGQQWPTILGLELTDRITVTETPQHVGDPWTKTLVVEGISHRFGPKQWETAIDLSPAYAATGCILELDTGPCGLDTARLYF